MSNKHTPGPWAVSKHGTPEYAPQFGIYAETDDGGKDLAIVTSSEDDARLIAASPELLTALEYALEHVEANSDDDDALNVIAQARAAIQKATKP